VENLDRSFLGGQSTYAVSTIILPTTMFDGRGLVDEAYKEGSSGQHGIYQAYKLALYTPTSRNSRTHTSTDRRESTSVTWS